MNCKQCGERLTLADVATIIERRREKICTDCIADRLLQGEHS